MSVFAISSETMYDYLPSEIVKGEVSYIGSDPRSEQISQKFLESLGNNKEWFDSYLKKVNPEPGETLPYHKEFGITEQEYDLMLSSANTLVLVPFDTVSVSVEPSGQNKIVKISGQKVRLTFTLNKTKSFIKTQRTELKERTTINQTNPDSPTGLWSGEQWKKLDEEDEFSETIAMGILKDGKTGIIYYDLISASEKINTNFIVTYPVNN